MSPRRALLARELRQLGRSRGAVLSSFLFPILMLLVVPTSQLLGLRAAGDGIPRGLPLPPGIADLGTPDRIFSLLLYPLLITLAGLMVPSIAATHSVVSERERKTLELLIALPVRVADVLVAKLLALFVLGAVATVPLLAITSTALLITGVSTALQVALFFVLLAAALVASTCLAFALALLARDFRTANNVNGVLVLPLLLATALTLTLVPGEARLLALAAILVLVGAATIGIGLRWITFERYFE